MAVIEFNSGDQIKRTPLSEISRLIVAHKLHIFLNGSKLFKKKQALLYVLYPEKMANNADDVNQQMEDMLADVSSDIVENSIHFASDDEVPVRSSVIVLCDDPLKGQIRRVHIYFHPNKESARAFWQDKKIFWKIGYAA
jgi:hypothetical protein